MRSQYAVEMALWRAKNIAGRGLLYATPFMMFGSAAYIVSTAAKDISGDIKRKNAVTQQTTPEIEPQVKPSSLRQ